MSPGAWRAAPADHDSSLATIVLVVGLAVALVGAGFGLWLILIGAAIMASVSAGWYVSNAPGPARCAGRGHDERPTERGVVLGSWTVDPLVLGACAAAGALYVWGMLRSRRRWPAWRALSFLAGLAVVLLALLSGIDRYADELLSVHVIEHLLLILLAPVLILWGAPLRLALRACPPAGVHLIARLLRGRLARLLTRPACGFALSRWSCRHAPDGCV